MEAIYLSVGAGILLGLASSLHCATMCCGISTSLMFMFDTRRSGARARVMLLAHGGRAISYATLGAALGWAGAAVVGMLPTPLAFSMLQWAAAAALMWIGLSIAGLVPSLVLADRILAPVAAGVTRATSHLSRSPLGPLGAGIAWGLLPCPMVYGALLTAMMTGTALGGATVMAAFALGTMPALGVASLALKAAAANASSRWRPLIGIGIAATGFGSVYLAPTISDILCR